MPTCSLARLLGNPRSSAASITPSFPPLSSARTSVSDLPIDHRGFLALRVAVSRQSARSGTLGSRRRDALGSRRRDALGIVHFGKGEHPSPTQRFPLTSSVDPSIDRPLRSLIHSFFHPTATGHSVLLPCAIRLLVAQPSSVSRTSHTDLAVAQTPFNALYPKSWISTPSTSPSRYAGYYEDSPGVHGCCQWMLWCHRS